MRNLLLLITMLVVSPLEATVFHLDPVTGNLANDGSAAAPWPGLEAVINAGFIRSFRYGNLPYDGNNILLDQNPAGPISPGDTLLLYDGLHGEAILHEYVNPAFITIMAARDTKPVLRRVHLRAAERWRFIGLTVSSEPYGEYDQDRCFWLNSHAFRGPVGRVEIIDCHLYSTLDNSMWTADDWRARVRSGIGSDGDHNLYQNNLLENINFGITFIGDSVRVLNNEVRYFSGDGLRILGGDALVEGNLIRGCIKINDNHDDGIQSFNLGTYRVHNNIVRKNTILNYVDPEHPLRAPLQGIGAFDGPFRGWTVENNVVAVDHWHGITFLGAFDMKLVNNTVVDPSPDETPGPSWIRIGPHKDGTPSERNLIANNIANTIAGEDFEATHNVMLRTYADYAQHFQDYSSNDFRLRADSDLIDTGLDSLGAQDDFLDLSRPQGLAIEPGAYEFEPASAVRFGRTYPSPMAFPNPVEEAVQLTFPEGMTSGSSIRVFDVSGRQVQMLGAAAGAKKVRVELGDLPPGLYLLKGTDWAVKVVKQ